MNIFNNDARIRVQDFLICDFLLRCVFTRLYRYIEAPARSEHKVAIGKCKKIQTVHGASCGMWRLANQVLVSGKNCCNQRQAVVVLALKAIWAICKSYQKLSKAPSHGVEMSQWRSWDPNFVLYGGPGRLAVWTALARWLQGALAAASVVHLQSLANVLSSRGHSKLRCIIGTYTDLSVLSKQEHKKSRKREAIQMIHDDSGRAWHVSGLAWFMSMSTCFFWIIQGRHCCQSRPESLHVQFQWWKSVRFFSWQGLACFGILWSCNSLIFDFVIGAKSPAVGADGPERT